MSTVRLLFAGDVMLGRGVAPIARADPDGLFADVRFVLSEADLAVANLESPLTARPHTSANPNALEADPAAAGLLATAGFDAMSVANNHAGDAGPASVDDTLAALRSAGIRSVGGGATTDDAFAPQVVERGGLRIALLSFDATGEGLRAGTAPGVAWWDEARVRTAVEEARAVADVVAVGVHGGAEYRRGPDPYLLRLAESLAGWGADVVWGQGPHVVQPVRAIDPDGDGRVTVVATSLGNLLFDQSIPGTQRGALLEVLAGPDGVRAYRVGTSEHHDRRVHFRGWRPPADDAGAVDGGWWTVVGDVAISAPGAPETLPSFPSDHLVVDAALGDATGDGRPEVVVAFRRPFRPTPENEAHPAWPWADAEGRSAHVGLYRPSDLRSVWVAGTLVRPVASVAACDGALAVAYSTLDDPATVATGAWLWRGFGFTSLPDLPGAGVPACADLDRDGRLDPVVLERSSP